MANTRANTFYAYLCILVFVVSVSPSLASEHNEIKFLNARNLSVSFENFVRFENNTRISEPQIFLPNGPLDLAVPKDTLNIFTGFILLNETGFYYQDVFTWSRLGQTPYVPCTTNCWWQVDENGFSVAHGDLLEFIVSWFGPIHTSPPKVVKK